MVVDDDYLMSLCRSQKAKQQVLVFRQIVTQSRRSDRVITIRLCHHHHHHQIMSLSFLGKNSIKIIINVIVIGEERSPLAPKR